MKTMVWMVGVTSPLHSKSLKKANRKRKVVQTPDSDISHPLIWICRNFEIAFLRLWRNLNSLLGP